MKKQDKSNKIYADVKKDPYRHFLKVVFGKWKPFIIKGINFDGSTRFNVFCRRLGISEKVLISNLKELQSDGLIERTVFPEVPPRVEYKLTDLGKQVIPVLEAIYDWGWHHMDAMNLEIDPLGEMWHGYKEKDDKLMKNIDRR